MFKVRYFFTAVLLVSMVSSLFAQDDAPARRKGSRVIDDTTKQVYGPRTSKYYFEKDVFYNRQVLYLIDTNKLNTHRFNYVHRNQNLYQDLGNIGTAIRPIFYPSTDIIGVSSGFHSYDLYWNTEDVKYYDTKSPYSNMNIILGGKGRSMTRITFSRNINPRWNFGFTYRALLIDKQIQRQGKGDRNVKSTYYDIYTAYQTKDSTYRLFFNYRRAFHRVFEYGGVKTGTDYTMDEFFSKDAQPWLTDAESNELRTNLHLFHQYSLFGKGFQLYHIFDAGKQENNYLDVMSNDLNENYFDYVEVDSSAVSDAMIFKTARNEIGIKGNLGKLFYNGYYALRHFNMNYKYIATDTLRVPVTGDESYLGGRMSLKLDSLVEVTGWAELMQTGNYRMEGTIKSKWFEASLKQSQSAPSFVHQAYRGSHDVWNNDFSNIQTTQLNGYLHYTSKVLNISPGMTFTRLGNYVYFTEGDFGSLQPQKVLPVQSSGSQIIFSPELKFSIAFLKHVTLSGQGIYTHLIENTDRAFRLPEMFVNGQLSYVNIFFQGNLDMQTGFDVHWKSDYDPLAYDPVIQQFYNQSQFIAPSFPIVDVFFNLRIKRSRIFIKYNNLVQIFTKTGYFPTPYYPGQKNILDFGFDWSFYD